MGEVVPGSYLADPTSPIPSHCAVIILFKSPSALIAVTSILRVRHLRINVLCKQVYR